MKAKVLLCLLVAFGACAQDRSVWREGDVVFHTSRSSQSLAIQKATHSRWSHMGMLLRKGGRWMVLEAVQPVKYTPVEAWIRRGAGSHVVAKRCPKLNEAGLARLKREGEAFLGRPYDLAFGWSDQRIYCSELVWKAYERALGLHLGRLQTLADFDFSSPEVQRKMKERYPKGVPMQEPVISPQAVFESPELVDAWTL